jgi:hypothetical protein
MHQTHTGAKCLAFAYAKPGRVFYSQVWASTYKICSEDKLHVPWLVPKGTPGVWNQLTLCMQALLACDSCTQQLHSVMGNMVPSSGAGFLLILSKSAGPH